MRAAVQAPPRPMVDMVSARCSTARKADSAGAVHTIPSSSETPFACAATGTRKRLQAIQAR